MIVVISGVSGSGKDTVIKGIMEKDSDVVTIPSITSREKRNYETEGKEYFFVSKEKFKELIEDKKLYEYNIHHNNYYGTSKEILDKAISDGKIIMKDIDVNGTMSLKKVFENTDIKVLTIFLYISKEEMIKRLKQREDHLSDEEIELRSERYDYETKESENYDYVIENVSLENTIEKIHKIIAEERKK